MVFYAVNVIKFMNITSISNMEISNTEQAENAKSQERQKTSFPKE